MTTVQSKDHRRTCAHNRVVWRTSEFIGIVFYLLAWLLQRYFPLRAFPSINTEIRSSIVLSLLGYILLAAGAGVIVWVHKEMKRHQQPTEPGLPTTKLLQSGPFRWSRNPTYSAIVVLFVPGSGILLRNLWIWYLWWPLSPLAFYWVMIRDEEDYLSDQFGAEWTKYCQKTRRWI